MRSFGLWYKARPIENVTTPKFSVHINFWSESIKTSKKKKSSPYLDIGIKIIDYRSLEMLIFHCPFIISEKELVDLSDKLSNKKNANIIFNTDGEIETRDQYSIMKLDKNSAGENLLIFPMEQNVGTVFDIQDWKERTNINFYFRDFINYIDSKKEFKNINSLYIRFRIATESLKNKIYFDSEPLNKSFESAFSGTRIIDFKINEKRNLGEDTITKIEMQNFRWPEFDKIHLLIMEPSSYDVESFSNEQVTCRELEGRLWDDYFGEMIDTSKGHVLAYHWKFEKEFSCLVKVKYSKARFLTILAYVFIVVALGIAGSLIVSFTQELFKNNRLYFTGIDILVIAILFGAGILLGKRSK